MRKITWLPGLMVVAICGFFAAQAGSNLVASWLSGSLVLASPATAAAAAPGEKLALQPPRDPARIISRNLFCSDCPSVSAVPGGGKGPSLKTLDLSAELTLVATLVSADPAWCFAAIRDGDTQQTQLHRLGGTVRPEVTLSKVEELRVTLVRADRAGTLELDPAPKDPNAGLSQRREGGGGASGAPAALATGIRQVSPGRFEVQRSALDRVLSDTTLIARSGQIVPSTRDGNPNGFTLRRTRAGSLYTLLGLQAGDTVHAINGQRITTPDTVLPIYVGLRQARHVTISLTRKGKTLTHEYTIR